MISNSSVVVLTRTSLGSEKAILIAVPVILRSVRLKVQFCPFQLAYYFYQPRYIRVLKEISLAKKAWWRSNLERDSVWSNCQLPLSLAKQRANTRHFWQTTQTHFETHEATHLSETRDATEPVDRWLWERSAGEGDSKVFEKYGVVTHGCTNVGKKCDSCSV